MLGTVAIAVPSVSFRPLDEYVGIVENIRELKQARSLEDAIDQTIETLPNNSLLKPYLEAHKAEVKNMLLTEYDEAETMELFKEEGRAEGKDNALINSIQALMQSLKISAKQAMNLLNIPPEDQAKYAARLQAHVCTDDINCVIRKLDYWKRLYAEYGI